MGNAPLESNMGEFLRCCKCHSVLPPCTSHSNLYKQILHQRQVWVFNGGQYFRPVGHNTDYECSGCFYKPITEQERIRKEEEERRRQEEAKTRQEEERRREEKKKEEERRKEEEKVKEREGEEQKRSTFDVLSHSLDELTQDELKRFKAHLSDGTLEGCEPIPRGQLEEAGPTEVAQKVQQAYCERSMTVTLTILRKMNQNNLSDRLQRLTLTAQQE